MKSRWEGKQDSEEGIAYFGDMVDGIPLACFRDYFNLSQYMESLITQTRVQARVDMLRQMKRVIEGEEAWLED